MKTLKTSANPPSLPLCLLLISLSAGCASTKERAQESMQKGNFNEAMQLYERAVSRDANDAEAVAGLREARQGWLGQKLIQARVARMAGNAPEGLGFLLEAARKQAEWKLPPGGNAAFTQEEETGLAFPPFRARVDEILKEKHPLKAEVLVRQYEPVFAGLPKGELAQLRSQIKRSGKNSCSSLKAGNLGDKPFYARFVSSYCQFWGEAGVKSQPISEDLYGSFAIGVKGEGVDVETQGMLKSSLEKAFAQTAWYDPRGKLKLEGSVEGKFTQSKNKTGLVLLHTYKDQEQYVENVPVQKTRQVPRVVVREFTDPVTLQPRKTETTEYTSETYWEQEPQTKYRQVERNHRYPAWKHEQSLVAAIAGQFKIAGRTLEVSHTEKSNSEGIEHDENQPGMGLTPSRPNLPEPTAWTRTQVERFAEDLRTRASRLWVDAFCQPNPQAQSVSETGERVMTCLHQKSEEVPKFADEWFLSRVGLTAKECQALVSR